MGSGDVVNRVSLLNKQKKPDPEIDETSRCPCRIKWLMTSRYPRLGLSVADKVLALDGLAPDLLVVLLIHGVGDPCLADLRVIDLPEPVGVGVVGEGDGVLAVLHVVEALEDGSLRSAGGGTLD